MPPHRLEPVRQRIHLVVDGERVEADAGEPVAVALAAAGRLVLGRSVKYHRPRGPACFAGRCDGCLMRVDGQPSAMTCRTPARDGMRVETQNVIGSARRDLLAATDWFFPNGMNHHEMFTWNAQVNRMMQKVARRVAGVGTLPDAPLSPRESPEREVDVLVVGAGPAGLRAASVAASRGLAALVVDEEEEPGGSLGYWPASVTLDGATQPGHALARRLLDEALRAGVLLEPRSSAVGIFAPWEGVAGAPGASSADRAVVAVDQPDRLLRVRPRRVVIATGRHEGASAFVGNDKPGVMSPRAAAVLLAHGVRVGERVVLVGEGALLEALAVALREAGAEVVGPVPEDALARAIGRPSVTACELRLDGELVRQPCDAIVVAPPTSAVFELAAQVGVETRFVDGAFELVLDADGRTPSPRVRVVGWAAGAAGLEDALAQAERAALAVAAELAGEGG
jgi:sarcosine oxidase subunit alpha